MINVTNLNPLFIQIPILVILLLGIISGFKDGIFRKLFDLAMFGLLIFLMVFIVPPLAAKLEQTGFIQNMVNKAFSGDMATLVSGLLARPTYVIITAAIILVAYFLIKLILNLFFKLLFKSKKLVTRILGAVWQFTINFLFVAVFLVILASPSIFHGGLELINRSAGVKQLYMGVNKIQEVLDDHDLPYDVESFGAKWLAGKDATKEDIARYHSTLTRMGDILEASKNGTIVNDVVDPVTGEINQEKANQLVDDVIVLSELMSKLPDAAKEPLVEPISNILTSVKDSVLDEDGNAKEQITVTEEQSNTLNEVLNNLGIDKNLINDLNKCIIVK